jgi:hypothetical protein
MSSNATRLLDEERRLHRKEEHTDPDERAREIEALDARMRRALAAAKERKAKKETPASQFDVQQNSEKTFKAIRDELKSLRDILHEIKTDTASTEHKVRLQKLKSSQVEFCMMLIGVFSICFAAYIILQ